MGEQEASSRPQNLSPITRLVALAEPVSSPLPIGRRSPDPYAMLRSQRADLIGRVRRRLQAGGFWSHLFGLVLRRHFQKAGIILVKGGWPLPTIDNDGGQIEIGNSALFS